MTERPVPRWLSFPLATKVAVAAAAVVSVPGLFIGLYMDDFMHLMLLRGFQGPGNRFELFRFASGDPELLRPFIERGPFPWWTLPTVKLWFWRPLSSAVANLDVALFGDWELGYHLHSLLWHLALVLAAALVFRRALAGPLGAGALLLFALSPTHFLPASWIANRNALIAMLPALLGLYAHLRWREDGKRWGLPLSALGYCVALTGGESALGVFAYVLAYEAFAAPGGWRRRALALAPAAGVALAYAVLYKSLGLGAWGSSIYVDPLASPLAFLRGVPPRAAALLCTAFTTFPSDLWLLSPAIQVILVAGGVLSSVGALVWLRRLWPELPADERRALKWLLPGGALSLVPVLATFPMSRLLLVPSVAASALIAVFIRQAWRSAAKLERRLAFAVGILHVPLAALAWPMMALTIGTTARAGREAFLAAELDDAKVAGQRVVMVAAPDPMVGLYPPMVRSYYGRPLPGAWWVLSMVPFDHRLTRTAPDTIELEPVGGHYFDTVFEQLFRTIDLPLAVGAPIALDGLTVTVLAADGPHPTRVAFRFDRPLEDPALVFLVWKDGTARRFTPPAVGETVLVRKEPSPIPM